MKAAHCTFIGGKGAEKVDPYVWNGVEFPRGKAVLLDPSTVQDRDQRARVAHMLTKMTAGNRFFKVEPVGEAEPEEKPADPFDHDGDGKPGGRRKKAVVAEGDAG